MGFVLVVPRLGFLSLVAVLVLAFGAVDAHAETYDFTVSPPAPNQGARVTFQLTPTSAEVDRVRWDLDNDGAFDDGAARTVTRAYANPGPHTVHMEAREKKDSPFQTVTKTISVNGRPAADFDFTPAQPMSGEQVSFSPAVTDPEGDAVTLRWDFGDGGTAAGAAPAHSYAEAGTYDVKLTATDEHGAATTRTHRVTVRRDPGPTARFDFTPANPFTGDLVTFTSSSTASQGSITATDWDLDGDDDFGDATGTQATWTFGTPGDHLVQMRVTQDNGLRKVFFDHVEVAQRQPAPPAATPPSGTTTPPAGEPAPTGPGGSRAPVEPRLMRPFPVVRIAGVILPHGSRLRILSVRAPLGAHISVRCFGRGCPSGAPARTNRRHLVRFHRFERRLSAGVRLKVFVRQPNRIGKYTRFVIRAGKPPGRTDRCLMPGRRRPVRCP